MAIKLYSSTLTHRCPKCNTVIKTEKHDDAWGCICVALFIPVGLIALIVYLVKKHMVKEEFNSVGEQIICCPKCQSVVAVGSNGGICGYSRIIVQEKQLFEIMQPLIHMLCTQHQLSCGRYRNEEKYSEMLGLLFKNKYDEECSVFIVNIAGKLEMKIKGEDYEAFDMKKLYIKILEKLIFKERNYDGER